MKQKSKPPLPLPLLLFIPISPTPCLPLPSSYLSVHLLFISLDEEMADMMAMLQQFSVVLFIPPSQYGFIPSRSTS